MQDSLSTFREITLIPISGRSWGSGRNTSHSFSKRSSGTAEISECITALTSVHQASAASLAVHRS
jgi:hypothetical protein